MRKPTKIEGAEFVEALARGIAVIESFDEAHSEMALSEVARRTGMSPATARRSLHTLEALGYIYSVNKRFLLAPRILTLGSAYVRASHVEEALIPELRRMVEQFGDAASVGVLDQGNVLYIAHFSEQRAARRIASIGVSYPAYATSMGRVLLAFAEPESTDAYLKELKPAKLTDQTETSITKLRSILAGIRHQGYAVTVDQLDYGITALAVPIRDGQGRTVAAINTSGYSGRLTVEQIVAERLADLRAAASRIAQALGRFPTLYYSLGLPGAAPRREQAAAPPKARTKRA